MMKQFTKITLTVVILTQCLTGCSSTGTTSGQAVGFTSNSLIWEITSSEGAKSHLFGTIHVTDSMVFTQRDTVLKILDASTSFWAELDLDSMKDAASSMRMASAMMLPAGKSLSDLYTPAEMTRIRKKLKERFGAMGTMMERMKPGALVGALMMDTANVSNLESVDEFLWERAKRNGIPTKGIELSFEQIEVLDSIPPSLLIEAIDADAEQMDQVKVLLQAYAQEDLEQIVSLVDSLSGVESFMLTLNDNRNIRMAARMKSILERGGAFIAVGTAHLGGNQGFLAELSKAGFIVKPVTGGKRVQWLTQP